MSRKSRNRCEQQITQSFQTVTDHIVPERHMPQHTDNRKGQITQPNEHLCQQEIAAEHFPHCILVFEFFDMLFNATAFVIEPKHHMRLAFFVADQNTVEIIVWFEKMGLRSGFYLWSFNVVISCLSVQPVLTLEGGIFTVAVVIPLVWKLGNGFTEARMYRFINKIYHIIVSFIEIQKRIGKKPESERTVIRSNCGENRSSIGLQNAMVSSALHLVLPW